MAATAKTANTRVKSSRSAKSAVKPPHGPNDPALSIFETGLGWIAVAGAMNRIQFLLFGYTSRELLESEAQQAWKRQISPEPGPLVDWSPALRERLQQFARGEIVDFADFEVALDCRTRFQTEVLRLTRSIRYGRTMTYGELAAEVGHPGAARAVGSVMASNRVPLIVPCHRVVPTGGRLGGFSAPGGTVVKQRLLRMEADTLRIMTGEIGDLGTRAPSRKTKSKSAAGSRELTKPGSRKRIPKRS